MRVTVTCEACLRRGEPARIRLLREITQPERLHVICPVCEHVLEVDITAQRLRRPVPA